MPWDLLLNVLEAHSRWSILVMNAIHPTPFFGPFNEFRAEYNDTIRIPGLALAALFMTRFFAAIKFALAFRAAIKAGGIGSIRLELKFHRFAPSDRLFSIGCSSLILFSIS